MVQLSRKTAYSLAIYTIHSRPIYSLLTLYFIISVLFLSILVHLLCRDHFCPPDLFFIWMITSRFVYVVKRYIDTIGRMIILYSGFLHGRICQKYDHKKSIFSPQKRLHLPTFFPRCSRKIETGMEKCNVAFFDPLYMYCVNRSFLKHQKNG